MIVMPPEAIAILGSVNAYPIMDMNQTAQSMDVSIYLLSLSINTKGFYFFSIGDSFKSLDYYWQK